MVRGRWIAALVFALAVAAAFAALGQWQLERAIDSGTAVRHPSETVVPLEAAAGPGKAIRSSMVGQLVTTRGTFVPRDYLTVAGRLNNGATGYWVIGRFTVQAADATGREIALPVARGWAPNEKAARAAVRALSSAPAHEVTLKGRLLPTEAPAIPDPKDQDPLQLRQMASAALVNIWTDLPADAQVYEAYVVEHGDPPAGLTPIYSPPPIEQATINWLNIFYAAEWAIFAGFAVFLWYRLVKDAWERERDDALEAAEAASARPAGGEFSGDETVD
jgi:cytochrome oxidase assembly protein ShyY1